MTVIMPIGIDLLIFSEYLSIYHKRKCGLALFLFFIALYTSVMNSIIYLFEHAPLIQVVLYILIFPAISFIYKGDFLTKYFRWLFIVLLTTGFNFIPLLLTIVIDEFNNYIDGGIVFIIGYIFSRILIYLIILKINKYKQIQYLDIRQHKTMSIKASIVTVICIILYYILIKALLNRTMNKDSLLIFISLFTLLIIVLMNLYYEITTKANELIKMDIINRQNKIEFDYAAILELKMEDLRKLKHDMKNHISMIAYFTNNNNLVGLKEYLYKLQIPLEPCTIINIPNQPELSALINSKFEMVKLNNIKFDFKIDISKEINIPLYDLSLIFGNILDNAIEASLRIDENCRQISLYAGIINDYLIIDCMNRFDNKYIVYKNGKYITSKNNLSIHGKGIRIMEEIANLYDGDLNIEIEKDLFKVNLTLKNNIK